MEFLGSLFIGRPLSAAAAATVFVALHFGRRVMTAGAGGRNRWPLAAAIAWAAYAAWEWLVLVRSPEANIRIDLLLIYPALALLSAWTLFRSLR